MYLAYVQNTYLLHGTECFSASCRSHAYIIYP